ncbi:ras GTPase-activating protein [Capsaspora owczarzaki ATCC 30864]|uniref:Ras GTPase-activating protein n=1 Tax=Capsaspora owczarzaki (strain ATCC 30864) TaxID=595528 RepID=A0A0D2VJU1_CAPO3|nr:ras GTPase-activating protein [Capsaspora owczarzaki ATCC 30864]
MKNGELVVLLDVSVTRSPAAAHTSSAVRGLGLVPSSNLLPLRIATPASVQRAHRLAETSEREDCFPSWTNSCLGSRWWSSLVLSASVYVHIAAQRVTAFDHQMASPAATPPSADVRLALLRRASVLHKDLNAMWNQASVESNEMNDPPQGALDELKRKISVQSKKNFALERDVRYLDSRIALLINHRVSVDELADHLEDSDHTIATGSIKDERARQNYSNLFFLLQTKPVYIARLARLLSLADIDGLLQTVMFTLYGNQYESREENLLLSMFESALELDFEEAIDMGSLMRANTAVSRMMTTYTRRVPGQEYLKLALADQLKRLMSTKDLNLEIEPSKIYEQMLNDDEASTGETTTMQRGLTNEQALAIPRVQRILEQRVSDLKRITLEIVTAITSSVDVVPYGIRWLCRKIRQMMKQHYPESTPENAASLIGGFFLLRFINPAIVTPTAYMLLTDKPSSVASRNLTLVAKVLQNLANKPNFQKEPYMLPLSEFTTEYQPKLQQFLFKLCEVDDFFDALEMDLYKALTAKETVVNITLNEMYNMHRLLKQHLDELVPEKDNHLRLIVDDMSAAPEQLSRKDNRTVALSLFSRFEQDATSDGDEQSTASQINLASLMYLDCKSLLLQVLRLYPPAAGVPVVNGMLMYDAITNPPTHVDLILDEARKSNNPQVHKLVELSRVHLLTLRQQNAVDSHVMCSEVMTKFKTLNKLRERVEKELESLSSVFVTICDHNNYLLQQLDAYKVYLLNVRSQAGSGTTLKSLDKLNKMQQSVKRDKAMGPFKFTHTQLEKDGVIVESDVPENRRANIYFMFSSPTPGTFAISLFYKGRDKAILKMNLKLDDLLEKQHCNQLQLDLEYVQLNVNKTIHLLNKTFLGA